MIRDRKGPKRVSFEDGAKVKPDTESQETSDGTPTSQNDGEEMMEDIIECSGTNAIENVISESDSESDASSDNHGHVNSLFQFDEDLQIQKSELILRFGGRGRGAGELEDATGITLVGKEKVLVTDMINSRMLSFNRFGNLGVTFFVENMKEPWDTGVMPGGNMYVTSRRNKCVTILSPEGEIMSTFGQAFFQCPCGVAATKEGHVVVTDILAGNVSIHESDGKWIRNLDNSVSEKERMFSCPRYVTVSPLNEIIVSDSGHHCIQVFDEKGNCIRKIGKYGKGDGHLKCPYGVTTDHFGNIIVADHYNDRISLFSREGEFVCHLLTISDGIVHPQGVALSHDLKLFVTHGNLKAFQVSVFKLNPPKETVKVNAFAEL